MRTLAVLLAVLLTDCAPRTAQQACRRQAFRDPVVREMITEQAGSTYLFDNQHTALSRAENDATLRCLQARGLAPPGGVESRHVSESHVLF